MSDVRDILVSKKTDFFVALATKQWDEDVCDIELDVQGYSLVECRHSDLAGDRARGGFAFWSRSADGLISMKHSPVLDDALLSFVNSE